jgi:hypothetical protein
MPGNLQNKPVVTSFRTILQDLDGQPLITIDSTEYSVLQPDGTVSVQSNRTLIVLVDGTTWNPAMAAREKDPVLLAVCATCRRGVHDWFHEEPPTHGLLAASNATPRCYDCGEICCPRHRKRCRDGEFRCRACARRAWWWLFLYYVFFAKSEES